MFKLIIAEKPSVAKDIARALGARDQEPGCYSGNGYVVTWAQGHLVELCEPEDYDPKYKVWRLGDLPILPEKFGLRQKPRQTQLKKLLSLLKRDDVVHLINACDAGREGELIFRWILDWSEVKKPTSRLWLASLTRQAILQAFDDLRPAREFDRLGYAARCRAESDWLVGINATRALSKKANSLLSVGRVQTPTLAMLVKREDEVLGFVPKQFFTVEARLKHQNGEFIAFWFSPGVKDGTRIWEEAQARKLLAELEACGVMHVASVSSKETKRNPPALYDLTDLQRDMNIRHGYTASKTLELAQKLYEQEKLITYPRTDSKHISAKTIPLAMVAIKAMSAEWEREIQRLTDLAGGKVPVARLVNEKDVRDHHAIIPTGYKPDLKGDLKNVYNAICRRVLAALFPPFIRNETEVLVEAGLHLLRAHGERVVQAGWREIYPEKDGEELPKMATRDQVCPLGFSLKAGTTTPPERYTDATLLKAMQTAGRDIDDDQAKEAMSEKGLGTPATRAAIIERIISVGYAERQKRYLVPTPKGQSLISTIPCKDLTSPELTGSWEHRLAKVEKGELSQESFMEDMKIFVRGVIGSIISMKPPEIIDEVGVCPRCASPVRTRAKEYGCGRCGWSLQRVVLGKEITRQIAVSLLTKRKTSLLRGFRSKTGGKFSARLVLSDDHSLKFEFPKPKKKTGKA